MTTYTVLILLSGLVIFSYLFDLFASKTKLPSVLLLLFVGMGLRLASDHFKWEAFDFLKILPALGTVGLILIVFEGSLELKYHKEKNKIIKGALAAAFFIQLATVIVITLIIQQVTGKSLYLCFLNAIPFSVISSSIAIPSVSNLSRKPKEFIIYESSFSDILGIILFNFALANPEISMQSFVGLGMDMGLIFILSAVSCLLLLYILGRISHHIKFFLIISILIMVYAIGQSYHLSSLILILAFGLFLNNASQIRYVWFRAIFLYKNLAADLRQLHQLSAETAFIMRTFFFAIFGFTIDISQLNDRNVLLNGLLILFVIYLIRFAYLRLFRKENVFPEGFISPRGLISILLYYHIPDKLKIAETGTAFLLLAVLGTSIVMTIGLMMVKTEKDALPESAAEHSGV